MRTDHPAPNVDPLDWLSRQLCGADVLLHIHRGDLAGARSIITSSAAGYVGRQGCYGVHGASVSYQLGSLAGQVRVSRLVEHAASRHDPKMGEQLAAAFRRYVQASTTPASPSREPRQPDTAVAELHRCAQAWWDTRPANNSTGSRSPTHLADHP